MDRLAEATAQLDRALARIDRLRHSVHERRLTRESAVERGTFLLGQASANGKAAVS
jgi:hypothetical protein